MKNMPSDQPRFESVMSEAKNREKLNEQNREKQKEFEINPPLRSPFPFGGRGVHYVPSQWRHPPPPPIPPMPMPPSFMQNIQQPTPNYFPGAAPTRQNAAAMRFQQNPQGSRF